MKTPRDIYDDDGLNHVELDKFELSSLDVLLLRSIVAQEIQNQQKQPDHIGKKTRNVALERISRVLEIS